MEFLNLFLIIYHFQLISWFQTGIVEAVVGGQTAEIDEFNYVVSVQADNKHICGGTIVGKWHILTAAHCFVNENNELINRKYTILVGVTNLKSSTPEGFEFNIETIHVPKEFQRNQPNSVGDIAIVTIKDDLETLKNFKFNKLELPVKIGGNYESYYNENPILIGYGIEKTERGVKRNRDDIEISQNEYSKLNYLTTIVLHQRGCKRFFDFAILKKHLCAQSMRNVLEHPQGANDGDDGSPLVYNKKFVIGILSMNHQKGNDNFGPAIYTRITSYVPFIRKAINYVKVNDFRVADYNKSDSPRSSESSTNLYYI